MISIGIEKREKSKGAYFKLPHCKNFFESLPTEGKNKLITLNDKYFSLKEHTFSPTPISVSKKVPLLISKRKNVIRK